jgi:hypothetical protein
MVDLMNCGYATVSTHFAPHEPLQVLAYTLHHASTASTAATSPTAAASSSASNRASGSSGWAILDPSFGAGLLLDGQAVAALCDARGAAPPSAATADAAGTGAGAGAKARSSHPADNREHGRALLIELLIRCGVYCGARVDHTQHWAAMQAADAPFHTHHMAMPLTQVNPAMLHSLLHFFGQPNQDAADHGNFLGGVLQPDEQVLLQQLLQHTLANPQGGHPDHHNFDDEDNWDEEAEAGAVDLQETAIDDGDSDGPPPSVHDGFMGGVAPPDSLALDPHAPEQVEEEVGEMVSIDLSMGGMARVTRSPRFAIGASVAVDDAEPATAATAATIATDLPVTGWRLGDNDDAATGHPRGWVSMFDCLRDTSTRHRLRAMHASVQRELHRQTTAVLEPMWSRDATAVLGVVASFLHSPGASAHHGDDWTELGAVFDPSPATTPAAADASPSAAAVPPAEARLRGTVAPSRMQASFRDDDDESSAAGKWHDELD